MYNDRLPNIQYITNQMGIGDVGEQNMAVKSEEA
jgi:hypothetical protein